jgi:hypothetical protein
LQRQIGKLCNQHQLFCNIFGFAGYCQARSSRLRVMCRASIFSPATTLYQYGYLVVGFGCFLDFFQHFSFAGTGPYHKDAGIIQLLAQLHINFVAALQQRRLASSCLYK